MALMAWKDDFSVKIKTIDAQHKKLVALLNQIHEATSAGRGKDVVEKILADLVTYANVHFSAEEDLLKKHAYPGLPQQKAEHQKLVKTVKDFQQDFDSGRVGMSIEIMQFLKDWLTGHILGLDKQYSAFLSAKGVS